ncbi:antitoxin MazE family protein [Bradyrhizobium cytisi]
MRLAELPYPDMVTCNRMEEPVPSSSKPRSSRAKVREHRERLRAQGLRPIQIWVPDVRSASFKAEAHRQSLAVSSSAQEYDDQAFIDSVSILNDE